MGILRLILALSVVAGHGDFWRPFFFIDAAAAVICFFIMSGFYMALVLDQKYTSTKDFFIARLWRLYPSYLLFTILYGLLWVYEGRPFDPLASIFTITLAGQDFYSLFVIPGIDVQTKIPIAQAWSVAVELELYLLAALMFKKRNGILTVFLLGLATRVALHLMGLTKTPYGSWLFFNVVVFFGAGGMGYLAYRKIEAWKYRNHAAFALALLLALICKKYDGFFAVEARGDRLVQMPLYATLAVAIPFVFAATKDWKWDKLLGELSYPIYLCHIFVFAIAKQIHGNRWFILASILILSLTALLALEKPLEKMRARRIRQPALAPLSPEEGLSTAR